MVLTMSGKRKKGLVYKPGQRVDVLAPAVGGVIEGRGTVRSLVDILPGGAAGERVPLYRVLLDDGREVAVTHDTLTTVEGAV